jgi:hypothetical protein
MRTQHSKNAVFPLLRIGGGTLLFSPQIEWRQGGVD